MYTQVDIFLLAFFILVSAQCLLIVQRDAFENNNKSNPKHKLTLLYWRITKDCLQKSNVMQGKQLEAWRAYNSCHSMMVLGTEHKESVMSWKEPPSSRHAGITAPFCQEKKKACGDILLLFPPHCVMWGNLASEREGARWKGRHKMKWSHTYSE